MLNFYGLFARSIISKFLGTSFNKILLRSYNSSLILNKNSGYEYSPIFDEIFRLLQRFSFKATSSLALKKIIEKPHFPILLGTQMNNPNFSARLKVSLKWKKISRCSIKVFVAFYYCKSSIKGTNGGTNRHWQRRTFSEVAAWRR